MKKNRFLLHNHSTWSDGRLSLNGIARLGEYLGAVAVVMSEHDYCFTAQKWDDYVIACREASTGKCAVIPGIEYSSPDDDLHVLTVGAPNFHGARRDLVVTLAEVRAEGGATVLAHPSRRNCRSKITPDLIAQLDAVEIWNCKADGILPLRSDYGLARARHLGVTVGMDFHNWRQTFPMWNESVRDYALHDGPAIAACLRNRESEPAWLGGRLSPSLERDQSLTLQILAAGERMRLALTRLRRRMRRPRPVSEQECAASLARNENRSLD